MLSFSLPATIRLVTAVISSNGATTECLIKKTMKAASIRAPPPRTIKDHEAI
jgi:hypothetical protein